MNQRMGSSGGVTEGMISDPSRRVLVVEDDPEVRGMLSTALRVRALTVDEARDGAEALGYLQMYSYSVLLLDLVLPGDINGFAILEGLRQMEPQQRPVVLVVTGAERSVIDELDGSQIHGIVRKPLDPEDISAIVAACADLRARSAFETMAIATMLSGAPFLALLKF